MPDFIAVILILVLTTGIFGVACVIELIVDLVFDAQNPPRRVTSHYNR